MKKEKDVSDRAFAWFLFKSGFKLMLTFTMMAFAALFFDGGKVAKELDKLITEMFRDNIINDDTI